MKNQFLKISDLKILMLDITSKCNLMCPQCSRVDKGRINPLLPLIELTNIDYEKIFTRKLLSQLEKVILNGNFGDPIASKYIDFLIEKLSNTNIKLEIFTNGSLRSASWWEELGKKNSHTENKIIFSIDGLKDTNPIYRVNSNFDKIIENASSYIKAGGKARWDFLVFDHNRHQLEKAKKLAKELGFLEFTIKKTTRFLSKYYEGTNISKNSQKVYNKRGQIQYEIKAVQNVIPFDKILNKYQNSWVKYLDNTPIHCKYRNDMKALFIDFSARVWPCCWLSDYPYLSSKIEKFKPLIEKYGIHFNSLKYYSLEDILKNAWFSHDLVKSWSNKTDSVTNPRFVECARTCSKDYSFTNRPGSENNMKYHL